ncbi:mechanosensitive ion channel family protein [Maricaulis sp. CAU 1757]
MKFFEPLTDQLQAIWVGFVQALPQIGLALIILVITWAIAGQSRRLLSALLKSAKLRRSLRDLLETLLSIGIWVFGILVAATILFPSLTPAQLLGALGIGGIAVGLAFNDIFSNFLAGVMIMVRKPMRVGDVIEVNGVRGRVEEITIRDTYLRELSNELVLMPNSMLFNNPVEIITDRDEVRHELVVGVGYGEDAAAALDVIKEAVESVDGLSSDREVEVYARAFGASSIDYTVRWWTSSQPVEMHKTRSAIVLSVKAALDEAGIEIPFPYRTLTFSEPLVVDRQDGEGAEAGQEEG